MLLAVLSMDVEGILDDDDEESDGDDLTLDVREDCPLLASDLLPMVLEALTIGEEGCELLWASGRDLLNGSVVVKELIFLPTAEPPPLLICFLTGSCCCFSGKLPVLFLRMAGAELEVVLP